MKYIITQSADAQLRVYCNRELKNTLQFYHKHVSSEATDSLLDHQGAPDWIAQRLKEEAQ